MINSDRVPPLAEKGLNLPMIFKYRFNLSKSLLELAVLYITVLFMMSVSQQILTLRIE